MVGSESAQVLVSLGSGVGRMYARVCVGILTGIPVYALVFVGMRWYSLVCVTTVKEASHPEVVSHPEAVVHVSSSRAVVMMCRGAGSVESGRAGFLCAASFRVWVCGAGAAWWQCSGRPGGPCAACGCVAAIALVVLEPRLRLRLPRLFFVARARLWPVMCRVCLCESLVWFAALPGASDRLAVRAGAAWAAARRIRLTCRKRNFSSRDPLHASVSPTDRWCM